MVPEQQIAVSLKKAENCQACLPAVDLVKPILLVDDLPSDAALINMVLKKAGVTNRVFMVGNGEEAIAYLNGREPYADHTLFPVPGVLLLDLVMPKLDGFQVMEWCRTQPHLRNMLIIVLSGRRELKAMTRAYALGAHSFLLKSPTVAEIMELTKAFPGYWGSLPLASAA